jgi:general secretion pathway protein J
MLAMVITAFIALLAYNGLSVSITAAERHEKIARRLAEIQLPLTIIERDIRHAVNRAIRDSYDDTLAAMSGGALNDYLLILTRSGWDNPRGLTRGGLQRVRYRLEDEKLWRESWSVLDRVNEEQGQQKTMLMSGVLSVELAFLDPQSAGARSSPIGGEWKEEWDVKDRLPIAVEILFELEGFGEVKRVYSIPSE